MDEDLLRKGGDAAHQLALEDIDTLSQHELDARIALLKAEIARCEIRRNTAGQHRASADALFRK